MMNVLLYMACVLVVLVPGCTAPVESSDTPSLNETTWSLTKDPESEEVNESRLPATSSETIDVIRFVVAEHERVRQEMSVFDYRVKDARKIVNAPGQKALEIDRVVRVENGIDGAMLVLEEVADTPRIREGGVENLFSSLSNSGKPTVNRYLSLPDRIYYWPNVVRPEGVSFRIKEDWKGDTMRYSEMLRGTIHSIDPGLISTGFEGGGTTFADHVVDVASEEDVDWRWETAEEGDGILRISRMSRKEGGFCDIYFEVDMNRGSVVTEVCWTPKGASGPRREVLNVYKKIQGVVVPTKRTLKETDVAGNLVEEREMRFDDYERMDPTRVLSLSDFEATPETIFTRSLPDLRATGGRYRMEGGELKEMEITISDSE